MKNNIKIKLYNDEMWYSGCIDDTINMPYTINSNVKFDATKSDSYNEVNPILISSKGRYVAALDYFVYEFKNGELIVNSDYKLDSGEKETFVEAYNYIKNTYYSFNKKHPFMRLFTSPQYCSWMELNKYINQNSLIEYAKSIIDAKLDPGELIIDDGWEDYYGQYAFSKKKFPNPKGMIETLNELGFFVTVWMTPYIFLDTPSFNELKEKDLLIKNENDEIFICTWWEGKSACIDLSNPNAIKWLNLKLDALKKLGVKGFKLDGGDSRIYKDNLKCYDKSIKSACDIAEVYGKFAANFDVSEIRSTCKCGGLPVMQRIADRYHCWEDINNGFDGIVKKSLVMSMFGYPYNCPDMIGGGQIDDIEKNKLIDKELVVRYIQAATLMPSWQFSRAIWKDKYFKEIILSMNNIRKSFNNELEKAVIKCANDGTLIIKPMIYFNNKADDLNQFILGENIFVAPVLKKNQFEKEITLPDGIWEYGYDHKLYKGKVLVKTPLEVLPYFIKK